MPLVLSVQSAFSRHLKHLLCPLWQMTNTIRAMVQCGRTQEKSRFLPIFFLRTAELIKPWGDTEGYCIQVLPNESKVVLAALVDEEKSMVLVDSRLPVVALSRKFLPWGRCKPPLQVLKTNPGTNPPHFTLGNKWADWSLLTEQVRDCRQEHGRPPRSPNRRSAPSVHDESATAA